jgi:hypothetical protein
MVMKPKQRVFPSLKTNPHEKLGLQNYKKYFNKTSFGENKF